MGKLNIYKRKDGRYEGRIYVDKDSNGNRRYKSFYGFSIEEVEEKYRKSRFDEAISSIPITKMTVKELVIEWLRVITSRIKESTASNYRMKAEKHIIPLFGSMNCDEIKRKDIYSFMEGKLKCGLSVRYVSDIIVLMKSIFKYAYREYGIKNVIDGIVMPKKTKPEVRILNDSEQTILKKYISDNSNLTNLGIAVSMYTGLRIGELCALRWEDIDFEKRTLTVRKTIQRIQCVNGFKKTKLIITEPKSDRSIRKIPIPKHLFSMLKKHRTDDCIFVLSGNRKPIEPRTMQYRFAKVMENLRLPSVHFHSLRHLFASRAIELGFDVKTLSELLGHSSIELTMNLYVHSSMDRKRACMDLMKWSA